MGGGWACTCCWADSLALHQKQQEEQGDLGGSHFQFWTPSAKHCHWHHFLSAFQLLTLCVSRHRFAQNSELTLCSPPHFLELFSPMMIVTCSKKCCFQLVPTRRPTVEMLPLAACSDD